MSEASAVPLFNIVHASAEQVRKRDPRIRRVGVLSTMGTFQMGIYTRTLSDMGFTPLTPTEDEFLTLVSPAIALIKANQLTEAEDLFRVATAKLVARGAEIIILGCTEIPIGMHRQCQENPSLFVDSTDALALSVIDLFRAQQPTA